MDDLLTEEKNEHNKYKTISIILILILSICIIAIVVLIILLVKSKKQEQNIKTFNYWVEKYKMIDHIEGGKFQYETYNSSFKVNLTEYDGLERIGTSICYYILNSNEPGIFHKLKGDECWLFHDGTPLTLYLMNETTGSIETKLLGLCEKCQPLICVKGGTIFAEIGGEQYTFVSLQTAPAFDVRDCVTYKKEDLLAKYPQNKEIIEKIYPK